MFEICRELIFEGDDNWDNDFSTSISPSALQLPHLKPHDNFGGLLSSDRLKAFASFDMTNEDDDNWDSNFEGDLVTIKGPRRAIEPDFQDLETIRPYRAKPIVVSGSKPAAVSKIPPRKTSSSRNTSNPLPLPVYPTPARAKVETKFKLPARPASVFREQSVEDYSDLFVGNDHAFERRLSSVSMAKVRYI